MSQHSTNFGVHRNCSIGDIMVLVCHIISQNHLIKVSFDFMRRSPSRQVSILQKLVAITTLVVGYNEFSLPRELQRLRNKGVA